MDEFVEVEWLAEHLEDPAIAIVDTRSAPLSGIFPLLGREQYFSGHIPGAIHLDYALDLQDEDVAYAALVAPARRFADALANAGVGDGTTVVAYDGGEPPYAARLVWMLNYYGHDAAVILSGGIDAWIAAGLPRATEIPSRDPQSFNAQVRPKLRANREEVLDVAQGRSDAQLLSVSADLAYAKRNHEIPLARRLSCSQLFDERQGGKPVAVQRLRELTADLDPQKRTITYCGNGVSAAGAYVALRVAGFTDVAVYDGSWADWSHHKLPVAAKAAC
jgi:thiosulfate/3-mercaptopyruvate sulfurtransferase